MQERPNVRLADAASVMFVGHQINGLRELPALVIRGRTTLCFSVFHPNKPVDETFSFFSLHVCSVQLHPFIPG